MWKTKKMNIRYCEMCSKINRTYRVFICKKCSIVCKSWDQLSDLNTRKIIQFLGSMYSTYYVLELVLINIAKNTTPFSDYFCVCLEAERNISNSVLVVFWQIIFFGLLRRSGYLERKQANIAKNLPTIHISSTARCFHKSD